MKYKLYIILILFNIHNLIKTLFYIYIYILLKELFLKYLFYYHLLTYNMMGINKLLLIISIVITILNQKNKTLNYILNFIYEFLLDQRKVS